MPATITNVIRLYIVESQVLFRKALGQAFSSEPGICVVGDAGVINAESLAGARPDIIVVDLDGLQDLTEALALCRKAVPSSRICVLSMRLQAEIMQRCLAAGAEGFIVKDVTPDGFLHAVKLVAAGETYVDPRVAGGLLRRRSMANERPGFGELTGREIEVVRLIALGLANKEISQRLCLSEKTIKNLISRIFSKLQICGRARAAVYAAKTGLI
ncbi:MAG: response regulator transcription factor [Candidatus Eremiobacteraeota bacterium]|nr:response regulator transcription factor [Candidatus Eremiobacteraeota bacterium]